MFDRVLVSVGRRPNSKIPGLDRTRVKVERARLHRRRRAVPHDEPSIFAIGDVVGEPMLAHKASHEGRVAVEVIAGENVAFEPRGDSGRRLHRSRDGVVRAHRGAGARSRARRSTVAQVPVGRVGPRDYARIGPTASTKLVLDPDSGRILGVGLVGPGAGELIAEGVLAIEMGATAPDLKLTIHPHPTLTETMMESAEVFFGQATHVYRPKAQPEPLQPSAPVAICRPVPAR